MPVKRIISVWLLFVPVAILNGIVRNSIYAKYTGELLAHQISTLIASILFFIISYLICGSCFIGKGYSRPAFAGILWVSMTILFEFVAGHYIFGNTWSKLLADYNIFEGRIWIMFLITEFSAPFIVKYIRR